MSRIHRALTEGVGRHSRLAGDLPSKIELEVGDEQESGDPVSVSEEAGGSGVYENLKLDQSEEDETLYVNALSRLKRLFEAGPLPELVVTTRSVRGSEVTLDSSNKDMLDDLTRGIGNELYAKVIATEQARAETAEDQEFTDALRDEFGIKSLYLKWTAGELRRKQARDAFPQIPYAASDADKDKWLRDAGRQIVEELHDWESEALKKPGDDFEVIMDIIHHRVEEILKRTLPIADREIRDASYLFPQRDLEPVVMLAIRDGLETLPARRKEATEDTAA